MPGPFSTFPSAPAFGARVPMQFISADQPTLSITNAQNTLANNPTKMSVKTGTVGKIELGINGATYYRGDGEFAPLAIDMDWKILGYTDYLNLAALRPYLLTMVTYRNLGYYGKLVMDQPQASVSQADIVSVTARFYVLTPSDAGGAVAVNRIATPTTLAIASGAANSGYIAANAPNYYWLTFSSIYGETVPQASALIQSATDKIANTITWTWPSTTSYCTKASIYCNNTSSSSSAKLLAEVLSTETASWVDTVGFPGTTVSQAPPAASTAYRGMFQMGLWFNETP